MTASVIHWVDIKLVPDINILRLGHNDRLLADEFQQAIIWAYDGLVYWRIYASLTIGDVNMHQ